MEEAFEKLTEADAKINSAGTPLRTGVHIDLGDLSQPNNNYLELLKIIGEVNKYVFLSLYGQTGGSAVFTGCPLTEAAPGMVMVAILELPPATKAVEADSNGKSPFYLYKNLSTVMMRNVQTIGDNAFSDCNSLRHIRFTGSGEETPPSLGEAAFLGSTPSNLNLYIQKVKLPVFIEWLTENATKFNNDGKDIILKDCYTNATLYPVLNSK